METLENAQSISYLAENIIGSEIVKLAGEVNALIAKGEKIYNLTVGDFNPKIFPIPQALKQYIIDAIEEDHTNYPPADGISDLRSAVSNLLKRRFELEYKPDEILIASGARPVIYSIFKALVDPNDEVIYPVPSWNNNHYTFLHNAQHKMITVKAEDKFMLTASDLEPHIKTARMIALCSPQNPTGTVFTEAALKSICELILNENKRRQLMGEKALYLMYDQIYAELTFGDIKHYNPVSLFQDMRPYTVFVDGISKSLAATGIRVGWAMGPKRVIDKMKAILSHVGAWAPKAEQVASAKFLNHHTAYDAFIVQQKEKIYARLEALYNGLQQMKTEGLPVDVITPEGAIYLTVRFDLKGKTTANGQILESTKDVTAYLLNTAKVAIVPFYAFGADTESTWYRISVGTCHLEEVPAILDSLKQAILALK
jgi:aspartate aminotransferase